jgi:voltage-gated potassium channel Kch
VHRTSWSERARYAFDNFMARGTVALVIGLGVITALMIFAIALFITVTGLIDSSSIQPPDFLNALWANLLRTLDPGTMGSDTGAVGFLLSMLAITMGGIFVVAILIGILTSGIESKLAELRKGRSRVIEQGHTVILGWSQQIFTILAELVEANANQRRSCIVILADRDKVEMEDEIKSRLPDRKRTRIVCRRGDPIDLDEIDIANVQTSRSIIVLSPQTDDPDADVIKSLLAITNDPNRRAEPYHVVAEIHDPRNIEVARMVGREEVELVLVGDLIARITAQTCRQPGLSVVYTELLDFGGDEIYFSSVPGLSGRTFGDAIMAFEDSAVIGLVPAGGTPLLNPPMDTVIGPDDRIVAISADDDTVRLSGIASPPVEAEAIVAAPARELRPERTLVLGWNWRGPAIITELDHYVAPGSELNVVADQDAAMIAIDRLNPGMANQAVSFSLGDTTDRRVLDRLNVDSYDHVIILSYSDNLEVQRADGRTLVTLLHLRDMAAKSGHRFSIVSEMLDMRNRGLAEVTRADDFIVSERLVSLYLSQISENKALNAIFTDIFDAEGSEIYLRPVTEYVTPGRAVSFYTVVEAARRRGEAAIGYRVRAQTTDAARSYGVVVNPVKSKAITFAPQDHVIVVAED